MSGKDDMWWMDEEEPGEEEYVEYFDTRSRRWVRVPRRLLEEGHEAGQGIGDDFSPEPQDSWMGREADDGGWLVFDPDSPAESLLRGRGEVRKAGAGRQLQQITGLKLYLILSSVMAGLLAASGRFLELGIVGASIVIVLAVWRWRGRWA
jgi:hypothetical protein